MQNQLFEAALGIAKPWYVRGVDFDAARKVLTIGIDFVAGSRFPALAVPAHAPERPKLGGLPFITLPRDTFPTSRWGMPF